MKYLFVLLFFTPCVFAQETTLQSKSIDTIRRSYEEASKFYFDMDGRKGDKITRLYRSSSI